MISLLIDHLVESTAFAFLMGMMTLCFANNRASVRYGLWFAASVKFLIPFSLIVAAGSALRWESAPAVTLELPRFMAEAVPDLPLPAIPAAIADTPLAPRTAMPVAAAPQVSGPDVESLLLAIWVFGSALLLCRWAVQWLRLRAVRKASTPAPIAVAIPVCWSRGLFEPGLVGILRPILLLPEGIAAQLSARQLALVIEHELCHWRRRDNLTAVIHMAAALVFWFHPLVWWIGRRLVAERERACDESVLAVCSDPKAYAASILEVCRFYVRSPLACAPGVAGANLTHRVERIMSNVASIRLSRTKIALLTSLAAGALLLPMASGLLTPSAAATVAQPEAMSAIPAHNAAPLEKPAPADPIALKKVPSAAPIRVPAPIPKLSFAKLIAPALFPDESAQEPPEQIVAANAPAESRAVSPPSSPMEEIVVTGKKIREFVRTRNFVRTYTAPSDFLDQISRWHAPLCVHTVGLAKGYNAFVTARIKAVAAQIGAPKVQEEPCKTNLDIIFNAQPQAVLDYISTKRPDLLGPHYPAMRRRLATVSHPVQAWYATGTRDSRGRWTLDTYDGWGGTVPGLDAFEAPVYIVPGSHLITGLSSEFASVVIVADATKVADLEIGTVADYIAMMALARTGTIDKCQQVPSVTNALGDCAAGVKAKTLSPYDLAYLKALYTTSSDQPRGLQEAGISRTMLKILEKQVGEKR